MIKYEEKIRRGKNFRKTPSWNKKELKVLKTSKGWNIGKCYQGWKRQEFRITPLPVHSL